jgi:hypothetical protein
MNRLEAWNRAGLIGLIVPETAFHEARVGLRPNPAARPRIFAVNTLQSREGLALESRILTVLSGEEAPNIQTRNDAAILANAHKYGCILVTADGASRKQPGGILGHKQELAALNVGVMSDAEAVELVLERIRRRDEAEVNLARVQGRAPAEWVGRDG